MWHKFIIALLKVIAPGLVAIIDDAKKANEKSTEQIAKAAEMIKAAEQSIKDKSYGNFTQLDIYDSMDESYLLALKEIWDSKQFAFFIDMLKHQCIVRIMQEDEKVGGENLLAACKKMRLERLFGDVIHIDKAKNVADAKFTFNKGICKRAVLMEVHGDDIVIQRSIHNSNLLMSKKEFSNENN